MDFSKSFVRNLNKYLFNGEIRISQVLANGGWMLEHWFSNGVRQFSRLRLKKRNFQIFQRRTQSFSVVKMTEKHDFLFYLQVNGDFDFFEDDVIWYEKTRHPDRAVSGNSRTALWEMVVFSARAAIPLMN